MSLIENFKQPFPFCSTITGRSEMAVFFGSFIFVFLMIFKPFRLDQYSSLRLMLIASVYGLITASCVFIATNLLPWFFPKTFTENGWTAGKQILLTIGTIFLVGLVNYLVSPLLVDTSLNLTNAIWFQGITIVMALLPVILSILLRQNSLLKKFSSQAELLEKKLQEKHETKESTKAEAGEFISEKIVLSGDYQNEKVEFYPDDLYIVTSANNYIKLFHLQTEKLVYSIIRSTLKKAEMTVLVHPNFFKCHRAFIINLDKVVHVEGNAQGYKVRIEAYDELIPVSRNLNTEFSDKLLAFRKRANG